ncbi:MAG: prepilin-type N-terminal cleavage/methylation domain-containing protein [Phycisphaerales bacterium]|nr:prepilin-type N-terminal cleavage/methylation domain-containing protein [Phycisphaerales bacterium]
MAFTLVELVCAMVIIGLLGSVTAAIVARASTSFSSAGVGSQLSGDASSAMEVISRRLRDINAVVGSTPAAPNITSVSSGAITFETNSSFALNGTQVLYSDAGATAMPIAANVTTFSIVPLDQSGAAIALPVSGAGTAAIQRFRITLTLSRSGINETLRTEVFIRSLMAGARP